MTNSFVWQDVHYPNPTGLMLSGKLYTARPGGTIIIVCHGFTGSKEGGGRALKMAKELGVKGYATMLFDFSGCGESEGDFADVSLTRHIGDLKCTIDFCRELGFERIITVGRSFGGTTAICVGQAESKVAGVCTWSAPGALGEVFSGLRKQIKDNDKNDQLLRMSGEANAPRIKKSFIDDLERYDPFTQAAKIAPCPLLIIHGTDDQVVPLENAHSIYQTANEPKKIQLILGADHQFTGRHPEVWKLFFSWLDEYFPLS